jgi:NDP-sugar pyrophosphorylase family protein
LFAVLSVFSVLSPLMAPREALILTAGLGTRLRPLTLVRAKPAIPVAGVPMIHRIVRRLAAHGVTDVVLNLHHRPETLTRVVGDGTDLGVRARYSWEQPRVLGSAGGPRLAMPLLTSDPLLIVNGDTLTEVDLDALARAHADAKAQVTLALVPNEAFDRYGGVVLDADRRVTGFVRRGPAARGSFHFVGIQLANRSVFAPLLPGDPANTIGGTYDALMTAAPGSVRGFVCETEFWDVGTVADYWRMSDAFTSRELAGEVVHGRGCAIDPTARLRHSILWDDVQVDAGAVIEDAIITDGVHVPAGALVRGEVLIDRAADR